jgi:hypothetical protein
MNWTRVVIAGSDIKVRETWFECTLAWAPHGIGRSVMTLKLRVTGRFVLSASLEDGDVMANAISQAAPFWLLLRFQFRNAVACDQLGTKAQRDIPWLELA